MDISFYETVGLGIMKVRSCMFAAIFVGEGVQFFGAEGLPIVGEHFLKRYLQGK